MIGASVPFAKRWGHLCQHDFAGLHPALTLMQSAPNCKAQVTPQNQRNTCANKNYTYFKFMAFFRFSFQISHSTNNRLGTKPIQATQR